MVRLKYKKTTELYSSQLVMVRELANGDIKEEILSMMEHKSMEDAITFVSMGEPEFIEAANAKMPYRLLVSETHPGDREMCTGLHHLPRGPA